MFILQFCIIPIVFTPADEFHLVGLLWEGSLGSQLLQSANIWIIGVIPLYTVYLYVSFHTLSPTESTSHALYVGVRRSDCTS